jgi:hypothetical protein
LSIIWIIIIKRPSVHHSEWCCERLWKGKFQYPYCPATIRLGRDDHVPATPTLATGGAITNTINVMLPGTAFTATTPLNDLAKVTYVVLVRGQSNG